MLWAGWRPIATDKIILASAHEPPNKHHLFALDANNVAYHWGDWIGDSMDPASWQEFPRGGASNLDFGIGVACWDQGRIDVVSLGSAGFGTHPFHQFRANFTGGNWTGWTDIGGSPDLYLTSPALTSERPGQLNLFLSHVRGLGSDVIHRWYVNDRWSGGEIIDSSDVSSLAACSWGVGRQDLFGTGPQHDVVHKWYSGGWSGWESLGGYTTHRPAVSTWPGRIDVFMTGADRHIYHKVFVDGHWSPGWKSLGGVVHESHQNLAASGGNGGPLRVYHTGTDLRIYENWLM